MNNPSPLPYRPCIGIMLLNKNNLVFTGQRIDATSEAWQMPQGGIDEGEETIEAAFRELQEETGIPRHKTNVIFQTNDWLYYDLPDHLMGKIWGGQYKGQKQLWVLMRFLGEDEDIDINTSEPEFKSWSWIKPKTLPDVIVPFKKKLYQDVLKAFEGELG